MGPGYWVQGFGFMWIFPLLFFIVFIYFMRGMFTQNIGNNKNDKNQQESARDILDKRFAKGEIAKQEYQEMKETLSNLTLDN